MSTDGVPHATYLSQLNLVDDDHVALSNQFWSKTTANLADNPRASVLVTDSQTYETYRIGAVASNAATPMARSSSGFGSRSTPSRR